MTRPAPLLKGFERIVATATTGVKRRVIFDPETTGLALIVTTRGKKSFAVMARDPSGKQIWKQLGDPALMSVTKAREAAAIAVARIKSGEAPLEPAPPSPDVPETFKVVAERFVTRWAAKGGRTQNGIPLRTKDEIERQLRVYLYPHWEARPFHAIRRGTVTELLDEIADNRGPTTADTVLATLNKLFNWYRQYDENYVNPIIPEMRRAGSAATRARTRILTDGEIRALWATCGEAGTFGAFVKLALLTGQRRAKVATIRWEDIQDGVWTIRAQPREKVNAGKLKLPKMALDVIEAQPEIVGNPFVFAGRGAKAFGAHSKNKRALDARLPIAPWVVHDLRRTARSLMSRAGVRPDHAERTLGHVIRGVEGIYDRYDYLDEKGETLAALGRLIDRILQDADDNVAQLAAGR